MQGLRGAKYTLEDTCPAQSPPAPPGSYLTLPAVDLEALEAEFQDDSPASGTVLVEESWWGAGITSQALPCPAQPQYQSLWVVNQLPHLPGDGALDNGPSGAWEG